MFETRNLIRLGLIKRFFYTTVGWKNRQRDVYVPYGKKLAMLMRDWGALNRILINQATGLSTEWNLDGMTIGWKNGVLYGKKYAWSFGGPSQAWAGGFGGAGGAGGAGGFGGAGAAAGFACRKGGLGQAVVFHVRFRPLDRI